MLFRDNYVWESCMDSSGKLKNIKKELGQDPGFFFSTSPLRSNIKNSKICMNVNRNYELYKFVRMLTQI